MHKKATTKENSTNLFAEKRGSKTGKTVAVQLSSKEDCVRLSSEEDKTVVVRRERFKTETEF